MKRLVFFLIASFALCACGNNNVDYSSTQSTKYVIDFDLNGGISPSYSGPKEVEAFTPEIFFYDCSKENWNFRGWSYNGIKVFDEKGIQLSHPEMSSEMTFVAIYAQTAKLTINSNYEGAGNITGAGEYPYNTNVDVSAYPNRGYSFVGWYYQETLLSNNNDYRYMMWSEDVVLEARFKLNSYLVEIHTNNEENGLVLLKSPSNFDYLNQYWDYRKYKEEVTIAAYSKSNIRFLGWYDENNSLVETNAVYTFVMPNRELILEAKWNYFTVSYNLDGGTLNGANPTSYTLESSPTILEAPIKSNYEFLGWKYKDTFVDKINPQWMDNVVLNAVWKAISYPIDYVLNGGTNSSRNPLSYTIDSETIVLEAATKIGYDFGGWYLTSAFGSHVSVINKGSSGPLVLYAKWIPIRYSITYEPDGGSNPKNNPTTYTIESSLELAPLTKAGYSFDGWYTNDGKRLDSITPGLIGSLELTAHWSPLMNDLIILSQDDSKGTASIVYGSGYSGEQITVCASPLDDCVFKGWYCDGTKISDDAEYSFAMPAHEYTLIAHFNTLAEEEAEEALSWRLATKPHFIEDGQAVAYGLYPQTYVDDPAIAAQLEQLTEPAFFRWYYYEGDYYAPSPNTTGFFTNENGLRIEFENRLWVKCEPIIWDILSCDNNEYLLLSRMTLDEQAYHSSRVILNKPYEESYVRGWLNNTFYGSAFYLNNEYILNSTIHNGSPSNETAYDDTIDKVFLLSRQEYLNLDYGFESLSGASITRVCRVTDWLRTRSGYFGSSTDDYHYWTRTPLYSHGSAMSICVDGTDGSIKGEAHNSSFGIRPAIRISLI